MDEHHYKDHQIVITAWQLGEAQWVSDYHIVGHDKAEDEPADIPVSYRFEHEAKAAALHPAQAWIDGAESDL